LTKIDELKSADYSRDGGTVVSTGLHIKGEISGNEDMLVDGLVEGPIQLGEGMPTVGARGKITADVVARELIVYGKVKEILLRGIESRSRMKGRWSVI